MIYEIKNKEIDIISKNEFIKLPNELEEKIKENFENMKKSGANIWNGEVICVSKCNVTDNKVEIICNKSNYAHYLYGERIGCPKEYECKNLSAGCLIETIDGFYIIGELDDVTSYPTMLQVTGGGVDIKDILKENINIEETIIREAKEELNIDLKDENLILYYKLSYMYITEKDQQPGVQFFSKAKINMTSEEMKKYFEDYYKYLKQSNLERELKKLHFLKKENAVNELKKFDNPRRDYLMPLIELDLESTINY